VPGNRKLVAFKYASSHFPTPNRRTIITTTTGNTRPLQAQDARPNEQDDDTGSP